MDDLLPQTGPARLITEIVRREAAFIEAVARVPPAHPLADGDSVPALVGIEIGAQAAAALEAHNRIDAGGGGGGVRIGYLARVREARFFERVLPTDTPLRVTAKLEGAAPPLAIYEIRVSRDGVELVRAVVSTYAAG